MDRPEIRQASDVEDVERILSDANAGPISIPYAVIKSITKNFAEVIGNGAFGVVYLGMLKHGGIQNGMVAVKKVTTWNDFSDKLFLDEVNCLKRVKHKNIVRFLGYCADTQGEVMEVDRKNTVIAEKKHRFLCFEYVPNGDLHHYLKEKLYGFQWKMRYQIIKGVCEALDYLQEAHIYHLDLKPANVLLGADMEPKVTDFGLSRCNDEKKSTILAKDDIHGTMGYIAPEMIDNKQISCKSDIYSLGIIMIRLLTGNNEAIVENWHESLDGGCKLMGRCIEIAQICVDHDPSKRPTASDIIVMLNQTEALAQKVPSFFNRLRTDPPFSLRQIVQRFRKMFSQTLCEHCRMVDISDDLNILERILEGNQKPGKISYPLLQFITRNFSDERRIGHNEFGDFFKGILRVVAVTRLSRSISDKTFHQEVKLMAMSQHGNIIRLLGNCSYAEEEIVGKDGEITIDEKERLLCFEYLSNGSLKKHLSDELRGLQWHTRYQIIRGICEGLRYLHKERAIVHMYLRPACILLDDCMVPKITEFGTSELIMTSSNHHKQREYSAPESMMDGSVSFKANIYSLGIIILELVTGSKEAPCLTKVLRRWKHRWDKSGKHAPLWYLQIDKCLELAQRCLQKDPNRRPAISHIVRELNELDNNANSSTFDQINSRLEDMLEVEPLDLRFPFEHNKAITRSVELINDTDDYFAFIITASSSPPYCTKPSKNIVGPQSRCPVTITLEALEMAPEQCKYGASRFYVQSTRVDESLTAEDITEDMFDEETADKVVDKVDLIVVLE